MHVHELHAPIHTYLYDKKLVPKLPPCLVAVPGHLSASSFALRVGVGCRQLPTAIGASVADFQPLYQARLQVSQRRHLGSIARRENMQSSGTGQRAGKDTGEVRARAQRIEKEERRNNSDLRQGRSCVDIEWLCSLDLQPTGPFNKTKHQ